MKSTLHKSLFIFCCIFLLAPNQVEAQIKAEFGGLIEFFLENEINGPDDLDVNKHGDHFKPAAESARISLVDGLNKLISSNISSFPLNSTSAGVSFDFSTGQPVSIRESLGPIFAETGKTLGKGKMNFGFNYTLLNFSKLRGLDTREIRFNFFHEDLKNPGLGDSFNESDVMEIKLDLNLNASIFVFYLTTGITENLDISVALPLVSLTLNGNPTATISSFTLANSGTANHNFGFLDENGLQPKLSTADSYSGTPSTGIGDAAVRLKYSILQEGFNFGVLLDARLPTGNADLSLGTGETNVRLLALLSKKVNDFTPHLNIGYDYRGGEADSDEFEFALGFDQKITSGFTFAFDVLGEIDTDTELRGALASFSKTTEITDLNPNRAEEGAKQWQSTRVLNNSNIPDIKDHILNAAFGLRFAPSDRLQLLGNILIPLNDGGLRPDFAATFGLSLSL